KKVKVLEWPSQSPDFSIFEPLWGDQFNFCCHYDFNRANRSSFLLPVSNISHMSADASISHSILHHCRPGAPGIPGLKGERGDSYPGQRGIPGPVGDPGLPGLDGNYGTIQGERGEPGLPGFPGSPGRKGEPGFNGGPGYPGSAGSPGESGFNGRPGLKGVPGDPGFYGIKGSKGTPGKSSQTSTSPFCPQLFFFLPSLLPLFPFLSSEGQKGRKGPPGVVLPSPIVESQPSGDMGLPGERGPLGYRGDSGWSGIPGRPGVRNDELLMTSRTSIKERKPVGNVTFSAAPPTGLFLFILSGPLETLASLAFLAAPAAVSALATLWACLHCGMGTACCMWRDRRKHTTKTWVCAPPPFTQQKLDLNMIFVKFLVGSTPYI
uniref:Collagen, type IV, alpha 6 n=1 Tax=Oryzias latipes TaxID=8090 RepID=A0A3P9JRW3_ORYLA